MNRKKTIGLVIGTIVLVMVTIVLMLRPDKSIDTVGRDTENYEKETLTYEGKEYRYNSELRTILFMGVDKLGELSGQSVGNGGQADSLILAILDTRTKTYRLLTVSRDTMTEIQTYDLNGEKLGTERAQITLQYAYGDGERRSCHLMRTAVSNLLYEIPIHSYAALTVEGFAVLTDAFGGIEYEIPEDYTDLDPQFEKGKIIHMDRETAEKYVRMRDWEIVGGNSQRMKRQEDFLKVLIQKIQERLRVEPDFIMSILETMESYMETDLTLNEMKNLAKYEMAGGTLTVPGEVRRGEEHDEFIVDNEALKKMVIELFYKAEE